MGISLPALDIKTPQQPDLLEKFGQLQALRGQAQQQSQAAAMAPLQQQAAQQGVQQGGLAIQQQQQQLKDQQAATAAMQQWDGKSLDDLAPLILKNGGSAQAVMSLKQHALDQKAKYSDIAKNDAATGASNITTLQKKNDGVSGALKTLLSVPDDQLPQAITTTTQQLMQQGLLDPEHGQLTQQLSQLPPDQARQKLDIIRKGMMSNSQLLDEAKSNATIANQKAEREQAAANAQNTQQHQIVEEQQGRQRIGIEGERLAFDKARQGTTDQQSIDAQAQQIAKYDVKGLPQSRNNPYSRAVMQRVYEINPGYSDEGYATNQDFLSSKGKANAQVQSLNKLSAHLNELQSASQNAGFSPFGFTAAGKDLRLAEQLLSKEDVKFLSGSGVGTEGELNGLIDKIHSPVKSVRDDAIKTLSNFTSDAARQLGDQYTRGTKLPFDPNQHFTPDTVKMMNAHGGTSARSMQNSNPSNSGAKASPPPGATHIVPGSDGKMHYTDGKNDLGVAQ